MEYLLNWDYYISWAIFAALCFAVISFAWKRWKTDIGEREQERRAKRLQSDVIGKKSRDGLHGDANNVSDLKVVSSQDSGGDFFVRRQREKQARRRRETNVEARLEQREDGTDMVLEQWADHEERKRRQLAEREAAEQEAERRRQQASANLAADPSIRDWADRNGAQLYDAGARPADTALALTYDNVVGVAARISAESNDLDHIINKLETSVDFISMEFNEAVDKWKTGEAHRHSSLNDLKHKFRLKTFSLDDAWELLFSYPDWINSSRKELLGYVGELGTRYELGETLADVINRAERAEWQKDLNIDMDVVFMLKEIKNSNGVLLSMQQRLKQLERACSKRSGQVIAPSWEPTKITH